MQFTRIGTFNVVVKRAEYNRNTNLFHKMSPFIVVKQSKEKTKKERTVYKSKKIMAKSAECKMGHKAPVWNFHISFPDFMEYKPTYTFKSMTSASMMGDCEIGRCLVDFTHARRSHVETDLESVITYNKKIAGTLYLSVLYESLLEESKEPSPAARQNEEISNAPDDIDNFFNYADGSQRYDTYRPTESLATYENDHQASDDFRLVEKNVSFWEQNRSYHKRFLYFAPKSCEIYEFDLKKKAFVEISNQSEILHPAGMKPVELPDGSYLLTGGRDAETGSLTETVVHYFEGSYYRRADIPTPRTEHSTVYMKGYVYCFGGYNDEGVLKNVEVYDMNNDSWLPFAEMKEARYRASIWKFEENIIFLFGGWNNFEVDPFWSSIERFDILDSSSQILNVALPNRLAESAWIQQDKSSILVIGGTKFTASKAIYEFDVKKNSFTHLSDLKSPLWTSHPPMLVKNKIFIFDSDHKPNDPPKAVCFRMAFE